MPSVCFSWYHCKQFLYMKRKMHYSSKRTIVKKRKTIFTCLLSGLEKFAISTKDFMSEHLCVEKLILKPPGIFFSGAFWSPRKFWIGFPKWQILQDVRDFLDGFQIDHVDEKIGSINFDLTLLSKTWKGSDLFVTVVTLSWNYLTSCSFKTKSIW